MTPRHGKPRPYRYLTDMPERASIALVRCHSDVVLVGKHEEKGITTRTLNVLVTRELIGEGRDKRSRRAWKPTEHGITLLTREVPRLLAARSHKGYTTISTLAMSNEPEAVDEQTQRYQTADAHDRMEGLPGRRHDTLVREAQNLSRRLRQEVRSADVSSLEVVAQLERIRTEIQRLEELRAA